MNEMKQVHKAHDLLAEALDTIRSTFWIQNKEIVFAIPDSHWDEETAVLTHDWSEWEKVNKFILADLDVCYEGDGESYINPRTSKAKITGVCSIGALTLADTTLYDVPLQPFESRARWDFPLYLSGVALAKAILLSEDEDWHMEHGGNEQASIIAAWNDSRDTTRTMVIARFTEALNDPLLTMPSGQVPVEITFAQPWRNGVYRTGWIFATEDEAYLFLGTHRHWLEDKYGDEVNFKLSVIEHESLVIR